MAGGEGAGPERGQQPIEGAGGEILAQHQPQPGGAFRHGGRPDRHGEQAGRLQPTLGRQGLGVDAEEQRQDRPDAGGPGPARGFDGVAPAGGSLRQGQAHGRRGLEVMEGRQGAGRQRRGEGGGVAEGAAALQQPVAHQGVGGEEGAAAAEGLAEGAAHDRHGAEAMGEAAAAGAEHAEGMGLIHQQGRVVTEAEGRQGGDGRAGAFHAVEAFAEHQQPATGPFAPGGDQATFQV